MAKKKKLSTLNFAELTGGKKHANVAKKKAKKAAKFHLEEMKISKKKFRKIHDGNGSLKKAWLRYKRDHADQLAEILLSGKLKNPDRYEEKMQDYLEKKKLFDPTKKKDLRKISRKYPSVFAYTHILTPFDEKLVREVLPKRVDKMSRLMDEKSALKVAPLMAKSDTTKVLRTMLKVATEKDSTSFSAKEFFALVRPNSIPKKEWKEIIVATVLGIRGHANNAIRDVINYAIDLLGDMPKDKIKKLLRRYADSISTVAETGEKLSFLVSIKDLSDDPKIEKVLSRNPKLANTISQV